MLLAVARWGSRHGHSGRRAAARTMSTRACWKDRADCTTQSRAAQTSVGHTVTHTGWRNHRLRSGSAPLPTQQRRCLTGSAGAGFWGHGTKTVTAIDCHAAGEPARVIVAGAPEVKGTSMLEKRESMMEVRASLITWLCGVCPCAADQTWCARALARSLHHLCGSLHTVHRLSLAEPDPRVTLARQMHCCTNFTGPPLALPQRVCFQWYVAHAQGL
jgi:hypothetical protein